MTMPEQTDVQPDILIVTGLSGAGQSTALRTLEDLGWETIDNLPLDLLDRLVSAPRDGAAGRPPRPLALGIGPRTRGFDAAAVCGLVDRGIAILFLDCAPIELERRYAETRRRHPLASERPAQDGPALEGIARERDLLAPVRREAGWLIDTTRLSASDLAHRIRAAFARPGLSETALSVMSFGFSRGVPSHADLVFDMRFLRNPHWVPGLRPGTGLDADVTAYVSEDPAYGPALAHIEALLLLLVPRYRAEGKAYVTIAFGCTGGRHRSVHVADRIGRLLREAGFSPTVSHRDLADPPRGAIGRTGHGITMDEATR